MSTTTLYVRNGTEFRKATTEEITSHPAVAARQSELESHPAPHTFHLRHLLVSTHGDLRIGGRWFEQAGFRRGARTSVRVFKKRLIIEVVQEPPEVPPRHYRRIPAPHPRA